MNKKIQFLISYFLSAFILPHMVASEHSAHTVQKLVHYAEQGNDQAFQDILATVDINESYEEIDYKAMNNDSLYYYPYSSDISLSDDFNRVIMPTKKYTSLFFYLCERYTFTLRVYKAFFEAGAKPQCVDLYGRTPLHILCLRGNKSVELFELFFEYGGDTNHKDVYEKTPFAYLMEQDVVDYKLLACFLEKGGANPNIKNRLRETIFYQFCGSTMIKFQTLRLFLIHQADLNISDGRTITPLDLLCTNQYASLEIIALCVLYGGNMYKKTAQSLYLNGKQYMANKTLLEILENKHPKIAQQVPYIPQHLVRGFIKKHIPHLYIPKALLFILVSFLA